MKALLAAATATFAVLLAAPAIASACDNGLYLHAALAAIKTGQTSADFLKSAQPVTARAYALRSWQQLSGATIPCSPVLRTHRAHLLVSLADGLRGLDAYIRGDMSKALYWIKAAAHARDLAGATLAPSTP